MDAYSLAKALHLVSAVAWFASLFHIVRLFVYHAEALEKPEAERAVLLPQYALMEKRLWRAIATPAMIGTTVFGLWLMNEVRAWTQPWFHVKLLLLLLLFAYHGLCGRIRRQLAEGKCRWSSRSLRIWNEVATVLLFTIVFTAVFRRPIGMAFGFGSVAVLGVVSISVLLLIRRARR